MARMKDLAIDLATLTARELADAAGVMRAGGVDPATVDLAAVQADPAGAAVPVLAGLIWVVLRRSEPRITPARCVRLAAAVAGLDVPRGG